MKLYQYNDFGKLNQALNSFKRNGIPVTSVETLIVGSEIRYFVLTDPKYEPKPQEKTLKPVKPSKSPGTIIEKGEPSPSSRKKKKKLKK